MTTKWQSHAWFPLRDSAFPQWIPSTLDALYFDQDTTVNWADLNTRQRAVIFTKTSADTPRCVYANELQVAFPGFTVYGHGYAKGEGFSLLPFAGNNPLLVC